MAEEEASCELYGILKRADEKYVTERAYDNPRFVEDLVRGVAARLAADARFAAYTRRGRELRVDPQPFRVRAHRARLGLKRSACEFRAFEQVLDRGAPGSRRQNARPDELDHRVEQESAFSFRAKPWPSFSASRYHTGTPFLRTVVDDLLGLGVGHARVVPALHDEERLA